MLRYSSTGLVVLIVGLLSIVGKTHAQLSCDDPFTDSGSLRFSITFWDKTDFCRHNVPLQEILSGGPPPDGIPPIDNPQFESIEAAGTWLQNQSPVIALEIDGAARAYPLAILTWHEIVNDEVGGIPVAVTFCPLCKSSIVFDRRLDGQTLRLGVSGNLRNSDMIMWDDVTQSWWQQFTGEGIVGEFTGRQLTMLPSQVVGFGDFAAEYPDGQVLSRETGTTRPYGTNPYAGYDSITQPFLFDGTPDTRFPTTERVLAGIVGGEPAAYPFSTLSKEIVVNDIVGGIDVVAFWQDGAASALDTATIDNGRIIGTAALYIRDVEGQKLTFIVNSDGTITDAQTGSTWNVFGRAVAGELQGQQLQQLVAAPHFWFAWAAFQPETKIYGFTN